MRKQKVNIFNAHFQIATFLTTDVYIYVCVCVCVCVCMLSVVISNHA